MLSLRAKDIFFLAFKFCRFTVASLFIAFAASAQAREPEYLEVDSASPEVEFGAVLTTALTFGGDEISRETLDLVFGGEDTETIDTGELIYFAGGIHAGRENWQVQATIGYHADLINGSNGDTGFWRFPLEVIAFAKFEKFRVGAGVSHHLNPEYERDVDDDPKVSADFDDETGFVIQADYIFDFSKAGALTLGLRYTDIEYTVTESNAPGIFAGDTFDGSNIGISLGYLF